MQEINFWLKTVRIQHQPTVGYLPPSHFTGKNEYESTMEKYCEHVKNLFNQAT